MDLDSLYLDARDPLPDDLRAVVNAPTLERGRAVMLAALQARLIGAADVAKGTRAMGAPWTEPQHQSLSAALAEIVRLSGLLASGRLHVDTLAPPKD